MAGVVSSPVRDLLALTQQSHIASLAGSLPAAEWLDGEGLAAAFAEVLRRRPGALVVGRFEAMEELTMRTDERGPR